MATKKKVETVKKAAIKKAAPAKKATAAKKVAVQKTVVPAKKAVTAKKVAPAKKLVAKKAAPAKNVAAKKTTPVKTVIAKKAAPKKAAPAKKVVPITKTAPAKKAVAKKVVEVIKEAPKKVAAKKAVQTVKKAQPEPKKAVQKPSKVVMPKISTKTSIKYQPEFTKSVLDTRNQEEFAKSVVRYSDSDLVEFKDIILRKIDAAKKELNYYQGLITRKDEGGDLDEGRYMTMEDGSISMEREQLSQLASRQIQFIDHLEKALMRIENKTYGICRVTGTLIEKARLRAVPHATLSMQAKMMNK